MRGDDLDKAYVILGVIPGLAWLTYFWLRGAGGNGSFSRMVRVFLLGCICTVPAAILERLTGATLVQETVGRSVAVSFLLVAPLEEFFKLVAVWVGAYRSYDFKEPLDGLIFAATAALGFASVENTLALLNLGPAIADVRIALTTPAHVLFSCMWGYSMGVARFQRSGELLTVFKGLVASVLLHGLYNSVVAVNPGAARISVIPVLIFMGWVIWRRILEFRDNHPVSHISDGAVITCPSCGGFAPAEAVSCTRCGCEIPAIEVDAPRFCGRCRAVLDPCRDHCSRCGEPMSLQALCPSPQ